MSAFTSEIDANYVGFISKTAEIAKTIESAAAQIK